MAWNGRAGIYTDAETGLVLMGARYYSPSIGRFVSRDPIGFESGPNPYSYCAGDPIDFIDPTGLNAFSDWYWGGMGGLSGWVDDNLMGGSTANFGKVSGEYDSGKASAWDVVKAGGEWGGNLGMAAVSIADGGKLAADLAKTGLRYAAKKAAESAAQKAAARASELKEVLHPFAKIKRTVAVLATEEGPTIVGGGTRDLSPAQRALLGPGETAAKLPGAHAEVTVLQAAADRGLTPRAIGVSRTICPDCKATIEASGGQLTSAKTAIWR